MKKLAAMIAAAATLCAYAVDPIDKSIDISAREDGLNTSSLSMVRIQHKFRMKYLNIKKVTKAVHCHSNLIISAS